HLFFDDRGFLTGYIGIFYEGIDLATQPGYAGWTAKQMPTEFILPPGISGRAAALRTGRLYGNQGARVSGRAIVIPDGDRKILYLDSNMLSPYATQGASVAPLLTLYKPEYLRRIHLTAGAAPRALYGPAESEGRDYVARQHFAKGEVTHFGLCGGKEPDVAV